MQAGKASVQFEKSPLILSEGSVVGKKEGQGPLGALFDRVEQDDKFGKANWEEAESEMQKQAVEIAASKAGLKNEDIRYLLGGDLLGQLIATSFGVVELEIPLFGLYGACSTMGEAMSLGAMLVAAGYADRSGFCRIQPFCYSRKAIPFSARLWKSTALFCDLDGNWMRGCHTSGCWIGTEERRRRAGRHYRCYNGENCRFGS